MSVAQCKTKFWSGFNALGHFSRTRGSHHMCGSSPLSMVLRWTPCGYQTLPFPLSENTVVSVVCPCPLNVSLNCMTVSFTFIKHSGDNLCHRKEDLWGIAQTIGISEQAGISPVSEVTYLW